MATLTTTTGPARPGAAPEPYRASLAGTIRSELTKLRSVRSTYWTMIVLFLAGIGFSIANCAGTAAHWSQQPAFTHVGFDATQTSVLGLSLLGQLAIVVLGTLAITSEYSTGMIRTALTVMPRRSVLAWSP
jgi:ABC-2 type transport system permease protein